MLPILSTMTAGHSSSNCHVTVAARLNKLHQTRALLGFCVSVFFMRVLFLLAALLFGLPSFAASRCDVNVPTERVDLDQVSLADLYECTQLRIPVAEQHLPYRDDTLGRAALAALDDLRLPLRERLKRKVSDIYTDSGDMP